MRIASSGVMSVILSFTGENKCIIEHEHFHPIVLLKEALWTALVGMHDREACSLPSRNNVTAR